MLAYRPFESGEGRYDLILDAWGPASDAQRQMALAQEWMDHARQLKGEKASVAFETAQAEAYTSGASDLMGETTFARGNHLWNMGQHNVTYTLFDAAATHFWQAGDNCRAAYSQAEPALHLIVPQPDRAHEALERTLSFATSSPYTVHLAMHGVLDERHPAKSGLVFTAFDAGGPKEGILYANALSRVAMENELVVLSGCKTALGKLLRLLYTLVLWTFPDRPSLCRVLAHGEWVAPIQ